MKPALVFSSDLPSGNAVLHEIRAGQGKAPPEVHFSPSPKGGPEAMWFYFRLEPGAGRRPGPVIRCVMHGVDCLLGGTGDVAGGFRPVFRAGKQDWRRVEQLAFPVLPDGRPLVAWEVPADRGPVEVALCYPYGEAELQALTADLAPVFDAGVIGVTGAGRRLLRLANDPGEGGGRRPGIYCLARQHAGETPGSWVLDGFLRQLAAAGDRAPLAWAVPFADPDGVAAGFYGKDAFPWDFNRAWGSKLFPREEYDATGTHPMRYEIGCLQRDMLRWRERCRPRLVIDFHAPGLAETAGIYCYLRDLDEQGRPDPRHRPWVDACEAALGPGLAAARFARSGRYRSRWETARVGDFANRALGIVHLTFETPYGLVGDGAPDREDYRRAGACLARAVSECAEKGETAS